jgi:heme a synthase
VLRLTQSGLSMTDWSITGSFPPITYEEWMIEFQKYQQFPEYQQRKSMTLTEFQSIYYWEYIHRMFGRLIGIAFIGPWMYYTIQQQIPIGYQYRMVVLGSMGFTQGLIGWWMVQSGLTEDRFHD